MIKPSTRLAAGTFGVSAMLLVSVLQMEGYSDKAYIPVPGDKPTIGAGRTEGVRIGDVTNPVREMVYLSDNLNNTYGAGVRKCITVPLYQYEFDSLTDLAYNAGVSAVCKEIAPKFNAARTENDYAAACASIENWRVTVGGRDCRDKKNNCRGLITRRKAQRAWCEGRKNETLASRAALPGLVRPNSVKAEATGNGLVPGTRLSCGDGNANG